MYTFFVYKSMVLVAHSRTGLVAAAAVIFATCTAGYGDAGGTNHAADITVAIKPIVAAMGEKYNCSVSVQL